MSTEPAKHTPGPWRISSGCDRWVVQEKGGCIACVEQDRKFGEANARLIAAAPELLEALTSLLDASQRNQEHYSEEAHDIAESRARAAIKKATGEAAS